jgi:predicted enzyme related to lactoylglutathione lyase
VKLVQSRFVTDDVDGLAHFYSRLVGTDAPINDYYVEIPAGVMTLGFSKCRFSEYQGGCPDMQGPVPSSGESILDFMTDDFDEEFIRIDHIGVEWVMKPTIQPWGVRAMTFRDPQGNLVNVFSPLEQGVR